MNAKGFPVISFFFLLSCFQAKTQSTADAVILVNQVAYNALAPKTAMVKSTVPLRDNTSFRVINAASNKIVMEGVLEPSVQVKDWNDNAWYSKADFSSLILSGNFSIEVAQQDTTLVSPTFFINKHALGIVVIPAIINFFYHQRASSPQETGADSAVQLFGSDKTVDLRGGWCDASGDVSKYFSHLAYTNFMSPQQIPLVTWSMINTVETVPALLGETGVKDSLIEEALYGADYLMRSLSPEGYFYMTVFSYFNKDPKARRVVGLLADSKTTADYQCAYREGGGMAIAALARISRWKKSRNFSTDAYLEAAKKAFTHLQENNTRYDDDGKENIIDDYCALMAASELWIATNDTIYRTEARKRAAHLHGRLASGGWFIADDNNRPFWHASDAGLPVIALVRYLDAEKESSFRTIALSTIKTALDYELSITAEVANPFGYARQSFLYKGKLQDGFFIPHDNESGWWWQGEDARLSSLATAAIVGGRLVYPGNGVYGVKPALAAFASNQLSWILGCNPYNMCMMFGHGINNVPYMQSMYGHGSGRGGISNGITGKNADGTGIDFKVEDNGNEWRWSEQWIPHSAWFLNAVTAMSSN